MGICLRKARTQQVFVARFERANVIALFFQNVTGFQRTNAGGTVAINDFLLGQFFRRGIPFRAVAELAHGDEPCVLQVSGVPFLLLTDVEEWRPPKEVDAIRMERRLLMLGQIENQFIATRRAQAALDHKAVYGKTLRMMNSRYQNAFKLDQEPAAVRETATQLAADHISDDGVTLPGQALLVTGSV